MTGARPDVLNKIPRRLYKVGPACQGRVRHARRVIVGWRLDGGLNRPYERTKKQSVGMKSFPKQIEDEWHTFSTVL